jgi:hypothetical protein
MIAATTTPTNTNANAVLSHHTTENNMMNLPYETTILSFEQFHQAIAHFRRYQADPANKPQYDKQYGTKYPGNISHLHYAFYALLRGKNPAITSHDPASDGFVELINMIRVLGDAKQHANWMYSKASQSLSTAFGLSAEQIAHVITLQQKHHR